MLALETCCCGLFSLKNGTRIISVLIFINSLMNIPFVFEMGGKISEIGTQLILVFHIIQITVSFLAFYDTFKERPLPSLLRPLLALLIILMVMMPIGLVALILSGFLSFEDNEKNPFGFVIPGTFFVCMEAFFTYCFMVVYGYYKELQRETEPEPEPLSGSPTT